jgi:hypothetical protein
MKRLGWVAWLVPIVLVVLVVPAVVLARSASGFEGVVTSIEVRYREHATRIPLLGLASLVARQVTHGGVCGVHVAEFEHFAAPVDGDELNGMVERKLGQGWERIVRETSRKGQEQTLIFARPEGNRMGLFVLDLDGQEMDVVEVSVDPDHLNQTINRYDHSDRENGDAPD